jgi:hypothetical protein
MYTFITFWFCIGFTGFSCHKTNPIYPHFNFCRLEAKEKETAERLPD